jgi:hypothetical protein
MVDTDAILGATVGLLAVGVMANVAGKAMKNNFKVKNVKSNNFNANKMKLPKMGKKIKNW